jgi:hypothetical protein
VSHSDQDAYFKDNGLDPLNKPLIAFAACDVGPIGISWTHILGGERRSANNKRFGDVELSRETFWPRNPPLYRQLS